MSKTKNYPSILRSYTEEGLRKVINDSLVQICYYYPEESPRHEIKDVISDNEKARKTFFLTLCMALCSKFVFVVILNQTMMPSS